MPRSIGYARVSTKEQNLYLQRERLQQAGCIDIFEEKESGAKLDRSQLRKLLETVQEGDTIVVMKLDRFARSTRDLLNMMHELEAKGVGFRSLTESIDTTTSAGRMMMQMLGAVAEFERSMINERTAAGRERAKAEGTKFGPKFKLNGKQRQEVRRMKDEGRSCRDIAAVFGVSAATISRLPG